MNYQIAPSILSANFINLERDIRNCELAKVDLLHLDIMDGNFVPNITFGVPIVKAIKAATELPLDCHLMIADPDKYINSFAEAGATMISIHTEATKHLHRSLQLIKSNRIQAGIALNPVTPLTYAYSAASEADFILLMSVNPGFGGQSFISSFLKRASELRNFLDKESLNHVKIQVDGGVNLENVAEIHKAGADMIVSGSALFNGDFVANVNAFRHAINNSK